jgi:hypothetical protein
MMGIASLHLSYAFQRVEWGKAKRAHPTAASRSLATVGTRRLTASLCPPYAATLWQISSDPLFKQRWKFHTHLSSPEGRRSSIPEAAAASPRSCGVLDSPPSRGMTPQMWHRSLTPANKTHVRILAADPPELCQALPSKSRGRREGRELAAPVAPVRMKCTGQEPQVRPRHPGLPCANGLRLIRDLLGDRLDCPRHAAARQKQRALGLSTGRPGPHDFTVRACIGRPPSLARPSQPASTYRDDAYVPLR